MTTYDPVHGQTAPPARHGGVRLLARCPRCHQPWYQDSALPTGGIYRLSFAEALRYAAELHADLDNLPLAFCRVCQLITQQAEITVDQYGDGEGFGFSYEGQGDPVGHLLLGLESRDFLVQCATGMAALRAVPVNRLDVLARVVSWLQGDLPVPPESCRLTQLSALGMAALSRPGFGTRGTEGWVWQGSCQDVPRAPLGNNPLGVPAVLTMAMATPPHERLSLALLAETWRALVTRFRVDPA